MEELTEELRELFGFRRFAIQLSASRNTLLISTDDGQFKLNELGGGIAQIILILGNATIRRPAFILIDEPEIGLHPKLQEVLVRMLASKAQRGLIASSHSVGLARSVAERIWSVTKDADRRIRIVPFGSHYQPTLTQSLTELGYSQFVEIGGNNILLVEGRTDVKAFREILRSFGIETSFIILSFSGGDFIVKDEAKIVEELSELTRINAKSISVIIDSERSGEEEPLDFRREIFCACCKRLGFSTFVTDRRATENYVTQSALDRVFGGLNSWNSRSTLLLPTLLGPRMKVMPSRISSSSGASAGILR
jgi:energy-coupling factor transporter ATP-binding protein EcfA2